MATDDEIIVRDISGLLDALATIRERLGISFETLDALAGMTRGHSCKILSERTKGLGALSFNLIVGALGLEIAIRRDVTACEKLAHRWEKRREDHVRNRVSKSMLDRCRPIILAELTRPATVASAKARRRRAKRNGHAANGHISG
jgi:hypothetical protein